MMKRVSTVKKQLEKAGFIVTVGLSYDKKYEVLEVAQESQKETRTFLDEEDGYTFNYAPIVYLMEGMEAYSHMISKEIEEITGSDYEWQCEVPYIFKMYEA